MDLHTGDVVTLKKAHPCGSHCWTVTRVGMDIKLKCMGCSHEIMSPRSKIERRIKNISRHGHVVEPNNSDSKGK